MEDKVNTISQIAYDEGVREGEKIGARKVVEWIEKRAYKQFGSDKDLHLNYKDYQELKKWGL